MIDYLSAMKLCAELKGKKIQYIIRSLNLVDIGFGSLFERVSISGKPYTVASFALHIQCPFRLIYQNRIIAGSEDMYICSCDEDATDLNVNKNSLFDHKIHEIQESFKDEYVTDIKVNVFGDLEIICSNLSIFVFVSSSADCEAWRFFEVDKNTRHLVISGNKFELQ